MWWSRRACLAAALAVAGCGFTPAYGPGGPAEGLRGQIAVEAPQEPAAYTLVRALEERLGYGGAAPYALSYEIALEQEAVRVTRQEVTLRYQLAGTVAYRVADAAGAVLRTGEVESFTSYSAASTTVATRAAERDARERLMTLLADRIVAELLATAEEWRR